jgi:hypothetical protein
MRSGLLRHALSGLVFLALAPHFGCGPVYHILSPIEEHPENEADCNKLDNCGICDSNERCGWCGGKCHAAGRPRYEIPTACRLPASPSVWIWDKRECPLTTSSPAQSDASQPGTRPIAAR